MNGQIGALLNLFPLTKKEREWGGWVSDSGEIAGLEEGEVESARRGSRPLSGLGDWRFFHSHPSNLMGLTPSEDDIVSTCQFLIPGYVVSRLGIWEIKPKFQDEETVSSLLSEGSRIVFEGHPVMVLTLTSGGKLKVGMIALPENIRLAIQKNPFTPRMSPEMKAWWNCLVGHSRCQLLLRSGMLEICLYREAEAVTFRIVGEEGFYSFLKTFEGLNPVVHLPDEPLLLTIPNVKKESSASSRTSPFIHQSS